MDESRTKVKVNKFNIEDYQTKEALITLEKMDDSDHPFRDVSFSHLEILVLTFQCNSLETRMGNVLSD